MTTRHDKQATYVDELLDGMVVEMFGRDGLKHPHYVAWKRAAVAIIRRDTQPSTPDGYPASHGAPTARGNSELTPTEAVANALAYRRPTPDPVHRATLRIIDATKAAHDAIQHITNAVRTVPTGTTADDDQWCTSCARFGICAPRHQSGAIRCPWCLGFFQDYKQDPPEALVRKHHAGERITQRDLERHVATTVRARSSRAQPFQWRDGSTTGIGTPPSAA